MDLRPVVVKVLKKHAKYIILNLANEVGFYHWADNPKTALTSYAAAYKTAIASMRKAGLTMPLMIDAPDCGTALDAFLTVGPQLITADPSHNLLLSAHAYWAAYDGLSYIPKCIAAKLPIVFGEAANKQDEQINGTTAYCYYDLDGTHTGPGKTNGFTYQSLLTLLQKDSARLAGLVLGPGQLRRPPAKHQQHLRLPDPLRQRHHPKPHLRPPRNLPPHQTPVKH